MCVVGSLATFPLPRWSSRLATLTHLGPDLLLVSAAETHHELALRTQRTQRSTVQPEHRRALPISFLLVLLCVLCFVAPRAASLSFVLTMASATSFARRSISERSIRVLVSPTPATFAERRSILQVLEQYGPVEVFKMTPVWLPSRCHLQSLCLGFTFKEQTKHAAGHRC